MANVIDRVVANDLCSGCGVCAGVCPRGILRMGFRADGDLVPSLQGECSPGCDLCVRICPFGSGIYAPRPLNEELFGANSKPGAIFHHHIGWYLRCYVGYSTVGAHRRRGASGGLATWALETLLKEKIVDRVAVVTRAYGEGRLFKFSVATSPGEVRSASGSVYYPVEISGLLKVVLSERPARWAIVGLPCLVYAVRRAALNIPSLGESVKVLLGLSCGMLQNKYYTELLATASGVGLGDTKSISYRGKTTEGDPGNYLFSVTDSEGRMSRPIPYKGIPFYLGRNAYFRLNACNYCTDVFAEASDACFMDAWLPEYRSEPRGTSIVVVRSRAMKELFKRGKDLGEIEIERITGERVCLSQSGQIRRKREHIGLRLGHLKWPGGTRNKVIGTGNRSFRLLDRADWWLQRRTQRRSKTSWARWGQRFGLKAFWFSMSDLVLCAALLRQASQLAARVKRLLRSTQYMVRRLRLQ